MILLPEWLHMLNYVKTFFSYPSTPPPLKSFKINMFNMLGFQNLPKHPKLQSASIGSRCSSSKGFFSLGFSSLVFGILYKHAWGIRCTVSSGPTWLCQIVLYDQGFVVFFFFKLTSLICFKKNQRISDFFSHQCQGHALVSVKMNVAPVHFWRKTFPKFNWF